MKTKILQSLMILILLMGILSISSNSEPRRVLMEFCTGTWCGYCPCGDSIISNFILTQHPQTVVLAYHGPPNTSSDPMSYFHGNDIITITGYTGYPLAIFDRQSGTPMDYDYSWPDTCHVRYVRTPNTLINLAFTSKDYNPLTGIFSATINATALQNLYGTYSINFVITEDNIVYPQTYYAYCGIAGLHQNFIHNWVVRNMVNGARGDTLNTSPWNQNQTITKIITDTIHTGWVADNCKLIVFIYKDSTTMIASTVQQSIAQLVTQPIGINKSQETPEKYSLLQNYPNPFNPVTNIKYTLPKEGHVSLKVYDIMGNVVAVFIDSYQIAGTYNAEFDGSNLASGLYFYTLRADSYAETKKMVLLK
ncbi:MAG: Omp28-related outer membrane protein [Ignavibacteria bacterium]|jgi:hypothetical protein